MEVVDEFISLSIYKDEFNGLSVASSEFDLKWKAIANREPDNFRDDQHRFTKITHYDIQIRVLNRAGITIRHNRAAIHDMIWSTSVQFGPRTSVIKKALKDYDFLSLTDVDVVSIVQDYKHDKTHLLFRSSPRLWGGLKQRAKSEKLKLLKLIENNAVSDLI